MKFITQKNDSKLYDELLKERKTLINDAIVSLISLEKKYLELISQHNTLMHDNDRFITSNRHKIFVDEVFRINSALTYNDYCKQSIQKLISQMNMTLSIDNKYQPCFRSPKEKELSKRRNDTFFTVIMTSSIITTLAISLPLMYLVSPYFLFMAMFGYCFIMPLTLLILTLIDGDFGDFGVYLSVDQQIFSKTELSSLLNDLNENTSLHETNVDVLFGL